MDRPRPGPPDATPRTLSSWRVALLAVALVLYGNAIAFPPLPEWVVLLANIAVGLAVLRAMDGLGYSLPEVGLSRHAWRHGWKLGVASGAIVVAVVIVLAGPAGRFPDDPAVHGMTVGMLAWQVLIRIPVGTALFEETMFRGVLFGAWKRTLGAWQAACWSSVAFAFWHVVAELQRQERQGHAWGSDGFTAALPVLGFLFGAGMVLCWLRERSGGVVAPTILHWAANSSSAIAMYLINN
jgi:membrane protease YdiL (CAAX protease family)